MRTFGPAAPVIVRPVLALAVCAAVVAGVLVATGGLATLHASPATMALTPAAAVTECQAAGPYRAPARGSVGVPEVPLCPGGSRVITAAGAVLDGWEIHGGIVVDAPEVVVRRSRVVGDGSSPFGIRTTDAGSVRIEDVTLSGAFSEAAIGGDSWSAERVQITGVPGDGARLGDSARLRNSRVHDLLPAPGVTAHALVVTGTGRDVLIEDNTIDLDTGPGRDSAVLLAAAAPPDPAKGAIVIRGNMLGGGQYTVRQDEAMPADVQISGNRFRRNAEQAPLRVFLGAVLEDNSYLDGGRLPAP